MGEGGAVNIVHRPPLKSYAESFRDWGRDCWCPSGKDNTCNKRFGWQLGELPAGYEVAIVTGSTTAATWFTARAITSG